MEGPDCRNTLHSQIIKKQGIIQKKSMNIMQMYNIRLDFIHLLYKISRCRLGMKPVIIKNTGKKAMHQIIFPTANLQQLILTRLGEAPVSDIAFKAVRLSL